jgi:hypothetical protein
LFISCCFFKETYFFCCFAVSFLTLSLNEIPEGKICFFLEGDGKAVIYLLGKEGGQLCCCVSDKEGWVGTQKQFRFNRLNEKLLMNRILFFKCFLSVCPIWLPIFFLFFPQMNQN